MKIRTKLTLRYSIVTALILLLFSVIIYVAMEHRREKEFFNDLKKEAITRANLFLENKVDATTMHSIYINNQETLDEIQVAIYTEPFNLIYHDANEIDLIKETPELIQKIRSEKEYYFYLDHHQAVGLIYKNGNREYVVTAINFDGYGYGKMIYIRNLLIVMFITAILVLWVTGYILARGVLQPFSNIVRNVEGITASNLAVRLESPASPDEIGELAQTFNKMLGRLEQSFDSQRMFVSNVSHELRTPLAALVSELEISLFKERSAEQYRGIIERALEDSRKLVKLSGGMLDMARASYDAAQISLKNVRIDEVLLDARELVTRANEGYCVDMLFECESEDERMVTVVGNEYLLRTAFVNLMENNCKFSQNKTSIVRISFFEQKSIIRFSDTGVGICKADMERLFTPFYRGENRNYATGNGIGMTLVHKIIVIHEGSIQVNSHIGEGTVFTIEIPHI